MVVSITLLLEVIMRVIVYIPVYGMFKKPLLLYVLVDDPLVVVEPEAYGQFDVIVVSIVENVKIFGTLPVIVVPFATGGDALV
jgi:hypothetical protein